MTETAPQKLSTRYDPGRIEGPVYARWEESGLMSPPPAEDGRPAFSIMIPPPNVTGVLHMGHALNNTMQDVVARHRRLLGDATLWLPGTDHAGIATQAVVEKKLLQERGQRREDLGREAFLAEVWSWREHHGDAILGQLRRLGCSCDWSRTRFTLDPEMSRAVREAFVRLWRKGLVYRGARLVNWDCKLQTAVSDDEIEYREQKGCLWHLRYPVAGDPERSVTVATTRPETMLGDTGVAVHPEDERYRDLIGATLRLPLAEREIPVVADDEVDAAFGTGAVKVTPGHDPADYERGARHGLPVINLLAPDGSLNEEAGDFAGMSREKARAAVVAALEERGLLAGEEEFVHSVPVSDRSKTVIEPLVSEQWFVRMRELAGPAIRAVEEGRLRFKPERWSRVYLDWLENVHDWCISRQLWWGHRIPVWYDEDGAPVASVEDLEIGAPHPGTGKPIVRQDEDVLDTWASSWLWPFATLGWPERSEDLRRFYPTQFLSTARDIIYLWVARMVMAGYEFLDDLPEEERCPFATCYIHATVLDGQGRRMSKSLGNGIDPVEMIEKYGADAVRFSLMILTREGQDVKLSENRFELGQRFCNKIWNAARFVLGHLRGEIAEEEGDALEDRWIRARRDAAVEEVGGALERYDFHDAAMALYRFTWDEFCDWYVEAAKRRLQVAAAGPGADAEAAAKPDAGAAAATGADAGAATAKGAGAGPEVPAGTVAGPEAASDAARVRRTLGETLSTLLRLLHPLTPFLTEALWDELPQEFRGGDDLLLGAAWPRAQGARDAGVEADFHQVQDAVRGFRNVRALLDLEPSVRPAGTARCEEEATAQVLRGSAPLVCHLAQLSALEAHAGGAEPEASGTDVFTGGAVFLPFGADTDADRLRASLERKAAKVEKGLAGLRRKLDNERFLANADPEIVAAERERLAALEQEAGTLRANLRGLHGNWPT